MHQCDKNYVKCQIASIWCIFCCFNLAKGRFTNIDGTWFIAYNAGMRGHSYFCFTFGELSGSLCFYMFYAHDKGVKTCFHPNQKPLAHWNSLCDRLVEWTARHFVHLLNEDILSLKTLWSMTFFRYVLKKSVYITVFWSLERNKC